MGPNWVGKEAPEMALPHLFNGKRGKVESIPNEEIFGFTLFHARNFLSGIDSSESDVLWPRNRVEEIAIWLIAFLVVL